MGKRVLFCIGSLEVGGAEQQLVMLVEGLQALGWQCDLAVLESGGALTDRVLASGATITSLGFRTGRGFFVIFELLKSMFVLWRLIRRNTYSVAHGYLPLANFIIAVAARFERIPLIITSKRALGTHQDRNPIWKLFERIANKCSDRIVANSECVKNDVISREGLSRQDVEVVYNGLDFESIVTAKKFRTQYREKLGYKDTDVVIIMIANLIEYKGHADAIRAAAQLGGGKECVKYIFVGEDRGIQTSLECLATELSVANCIRFLGRRADIPELLSAADIGLVASHEEGFCNALLEQMAAGLSVVATRVGGNPEALNYGEFGLLVEAKSPDSMAVAISSLAVDTSQREVYGAKACQRVKENYSVDAMVGRYIDLYQARD